MRFRFYFVFLLLILSIALKEMRFVSFFVFYILAMPVSLFLLTWNSKKVEYVFLTLLVVFAGFLLFEAIKPHIIKYTPFFSAKESTDFLKWVSARRAYRSYGKTAFLVDWDLFNPLSLAIFVPAALFIAWLAPFPWQLGSMQQVMAVPEMLVYYFLIPAMLTGIKFVMKRRSFEGYMMIVYVFIMMLVLAFIEGNIGTLFRHRAMVMPLIFIFIGIGLSRKHKPEKLSDTI